MAAEAKPIVAKKKPTGESKAARPKARRRRSQGLTLTVKFLRGQEQEPRALLIS